MEITLLENDVTKIETDVLVVNLFEGVTSPAGATGAVDKVIGGLITALISDGEISGSERLQKAAAEALTSGEKKWTDAAKFLKGLESNLAAGREERVRCKAIIEQTNSSIRSEERRVGKECRSRWSAYH